MSANRWIPHFPHFLQTLVLAVVLASSAEESSNNRGKRQQLSYHPRRAGKPPPYAVQMEPPVRYSQRDPLYKPLASAKSDDFSYDEPHHHHHSPYSSEPEPIIEIIIKESNETLPTPVPPTYPSARPTKEPIQVFYVKYEKKDQGDGHSKVIYDTPVPALNPHEEHEEIKPEGPSYDDEPVYATPAPSNEPSTTLRAIIRPESESYHAGGSGIRVTFGTDQVPPNNHNKRSDLDGKTKVTPAAPPPSTSRKQHGPFPPPHNPHRVPPAFPQQRIVNSFAPQQQLPQTYPGQHFQGPLPASLQRPRPPITIQGLPELQQRLPFQGFGQPHRVAINHPQQPGFPPALSVSHQNVNFQNQSPQFFNQPQSFDPSYQLYRQQEEDKQRYHHDQRRQQELQRQQEVQRQQDLQRQQDAQRQKEILRQQDHQRIKQQDNKIRDQHHQQFNQPNFPQTHQNHLNNRVVQSPPQHHREPEKPSEILKAVPKLEQHYAIRENPHHPGPFPPNAPQLPAQFSQNPPNNYVQQHAQVQQTNSAGIQQSNHGNYVSSTIAPLSQTPSSPRLPANQQFFSQNLGQAQYQQLQQPLASVWGRPVFKDSKQKIYATPVTHTTGEPGPVQRTVTSTTLAPTTIRTTTTTTEAPTTPRNEARIKENIANLPDEVPEDIRQQLLSSGILGNADIQVLDYDKVGDIPLENLPPEALANFYGAGGGGVVAASEPVPSIAKYQKTSGSSHSPKKATTSKVEQATLKPGGVEMKVVRFDPNTAQGQAIADQHIREDATHLKPVTVGSKYDGQYNRYLPLKVSGTSFPIPDVPELRDRKITSVVVLAPVDHRSDEEVDRQARKLGEPMPVKFLAGDSLKQLIRKPNADNYKKWLDQERRTEPQKQSVVLLVTT